MVLERRTTDWPALSPAFPRGEHRQDPTACLMVWMKWVRTAHHSRPPGGTTRKPRKTPLDLAAQVGQMQEKILREAAGQDQQGQVEVAPDSGTVLAASR